MGFNRDKHLDRTGLELLRLLQVNARASFSALGRQLGLSAPAVADRARKFEEAKLITGYHAEVNPAALGWTVSAFIRLTTTTDKYPRVLALAERLPEIRECHHVAGSEAFLIKVLAQSVAQLEDVITQLSPFGQTATSIVLSSPIVKFVIEPALPHD